MAAGVIAAVPALVMRRVKVARHSLIGSGRKGVILSLKLPFLWNERLVVIDIDRDDLVLLSLPALLPNVLLVVQSIFN